MWEVITSVVFDAWFEQQPATVQQDFLSYMLLLEHKGPQLGRPYADTIKASKHPNMKELRVQSMGEPFRAFFAFDPVRQAIVLCAGNKRGKNEKQFYEEMIKQADRVYGEHLAQLNKEVETWPR